jgi:hypothetical protein
MKILAFILCTLFSINTFAVGYEYRGPRHLSSLTIEEHILTDFSPSSSLIRIEDGSHFKTSVSSHRTLLDWRPGDRIIITPNTSYFSFYTYTIHNVTLGSVVVADLQYGPAIGNRLAKQVYELDYRNEFLRLTDNSYWFISDDDLDKFYEWNESDYIIIGSSQKSLYKNILINVNLNHYIKAYLYE